MRAVGREGPWSSACSRCFAEIGDFKSRYIEYEILAREYKWPPSEIRNLTTRERRWWTRVVTRRIDAYHTSMEEAMN